MENRKSCTLKIRGGETHMLNRTDLLERQEKDHLCNGRGQEHWV